LPARRGFPVEKSPRISNVGVVREFGSSSVSLAGSLLIAHPSLLDPNFRKAVLFISTNDPDVGSFGLTLNRVAGRSVGDLLPDKELGALARVQVFVGGPVGTEQLIFASFQWHPETRRIECRHHLGLEEAQASMQSEQTVVRAFIGYAGWTKGQLEGELKQRAWLVGKPGRDVLDASRCENLWRDTLREFGPYFELIADAPDDL
jgi:putative transcriptional regulator